MEKIRVLLGRIGASDELINQLCEEFERYTGSLKQKYEKSLQESLRASKQICIEEVQREKANLARKVGVYFESKNNTVEQAMARQRVAEESEATSVLKKAKAILEDVKIDESGGSRELLALQKKSSRLEKALGTLREERNRAVNKANKANDIALKVLDRNRLYESKLVAAGLIKESKGGSAVCECGSALAEGKKKCVKCEKVASEGTLPPALEKFKKTKGGDKKDDKGCKTCKCEPCECPKESKDRKGKRLDESRNRAVKPTSTRRSLVESVASRAASRKKAAQGGGQINKIASEMPE